MFDPRPAHAAAFLARFPTLPENQVVALMDRHASEELATVFFEATQSLVAEVAALVPADVRNELAEKVGSLILIGYLLHAEETAAFLPPMPTAKV